jgi:hypothetical protein
MAITTLQEAMPQSPSPSVEELQNLLSKSRKFNKDFNRRFRSSQERLNEMMS